MTDGYPKGRTRYGVRTARSAVALAVATLALAGCAITPKPMSPEEQSTLAQQDLAKLIAEAEPVKAPISLSEAMARAMRHNLEFRVRQMEVAVQAQQLDLSNYDMLPRLVLSAGYNWRGNDAFGLGYTPSGSISTTPSAATERVHSTAAAAFSWNVLDFGLSYYRAKQNADQVLLMQERQRRALQNLVLDVQLAWWRAEAAQRLLPEIDNMLAQIDRGAERSRLIEARRLLPPLQIIAYRRSLLDLQQQLSQRRQDLSQWRSEFAELIGLRPGESFRVAAPASLGMPLPDLITRADDLEAMALEHRPELAEERYRVRMTSAEGKRQLLQLLPLPALNLGSQYDSNRFLINNQWTEGSGLISFNLLKLLSLPAVKRSAEAAEKLDSARRAAATSAVMAQTRISINRYELLRHEYMVWNQALADDRALLKAMQATREAGLETELELIRASARLAITQINRDIVHANLEHSMGRVMNSVGHDVLTSDSSISETASLATQLQEALGKFTDQNFAATAAPALKQAAIGEVTGVPPEAMRDFTDSMRTVLRVAQVPVVEKGAMVQAQVNVQLAPKQESGRPVSVKISLADGSTGNVLHTTQLNSMLVEPVTPDQWKVLGEASMFKVAETLRQMLGARPVLPPDTLGMTDGGVLKLERTWLGPRPATTPVQ